MKINNWMIPIVVLIVLTACGDETTNVDVSATPEQVQTFAQYPTKVSASVTILADGIVQFVYPPITLAFETGGRLLSVNVKVGDLVQEGDILAQLEPSELIDSYHAAVTSAALSVLNAQQTVDALFGNSDLRNAQALQSVIYAEEVYRIAQNNYNNLWTSVSETSLTTAQSNVTLEADSLKKAEIDYAPYRDKPDGNLEKAYYGSVWAAAQMAYDKAVRQLNYLTGSPSDYVQAQKEVDLALAKANYSIAQANYDALREGIDPDEMALAEAVLANSQAQLTLAQNALTKVIDGAVLVASTSGTVLSVVAAPGEKLGGGYPIITLMDTTQMEFHTYNLSERDFNLIYSEQKVVITLKAYPNQPIEGEVVRIEWQPGGTVGDAATFPVIIVLEETELDIRPGMTGRAEIQSD